MIKVNSKEIDETRILKEMQYHEADNHEVARNKACEALIIGELLQQKACQLGFSDNVDHFLEQTLDQDLETPEASDEVCRRYYENNLDKFFSSPLVEGRHILLTVQQGNERERNEAMLMAQSLIEQLGHNIEDFEMLARQHSRCPSSKTGGHLGQIGKGQTVPEFERQLFASKPGLVKQALESRYGLHVVCIDHMEPGKQLPFEAVKSRIVEYLNDRVRFKAIAHYLQSLVIEADIEGYEFDGGSSPLMQ